MYPNVIDGSALETSPAWLVSRAGPCPRQHGQEWCARGQGLHGPRPCSLRPWSLLRAAPRLWLQFEVRESLSDKSNQSTKQGSGSFHCRDGVCFSCGVARGWGWGARAAVSGGPLGFSTCNPLSPHLSCEVSGLCPLPERKVRAGKLLTCSRSRCARGQSSMRAHTGASERHWTVPGAPS